MVLIALVMIALSHAIFFVMGTWCALIDEVDGYEYMDISSFDYQHIFDQIDKYDHDTSGYRYALDEYYSMSPSGFQVPIMNDGQKDSHNHVKDFTPNPSLQSDGIKEIRCFEVNLPSTRIQTKVNTWVFEEPCRVENQITKTESEAVIELKRLLKVTEDQTSSELYEAAIKAIAEKINTTIPLIRYKNFEITKLEFLRSLNTFRSEQGLMKIKRLEDIMTAYEYALLILAR